LSFNTEILPPVPEPRQVRDGTSFPLHTLQAHGLRKLAATNGAWPRTCQDQLGKFPESFGHQPLFFSLFQCVRHRHNGAAAQQ